MINVSTKFMNRFAGKWVAVDTIKERIVAVGETLSEIEPIVTLSVRDTTPDEKIPAAFKVPHKDEGPYILWLQNHFINSLSLLFRWFHVFPCSIFDIFYWRKKEYGLKL